MRNWYCVDDTPVLRRWEYYGVERRSLRTMLSGKFVAAGFCFSRLMGLVHSARAAVSVAGNIIDYGSQGADVAIDS
jgi:hypothetical protein